MAKRRWPIPCRECGTLSLETLCPTHLANAKELHELKRAAIKRQRTHYSGNYRKRAKQVRDTALVCHLCGEAARVDDPWQADHIIPGDSNSPLAPAHRSCNARRGNKPIN